MAERECDLCGLACGKHPLTHRITDRDLAFCCLGCLNVYIILSESGVLASGQDIRETELFKRSMALGLISQRDRELPAGEGDPNSPLAATTEELLLDISGLWCSSCAWLIENVTAKIPGVTRAEVSFASDTAKITYQPQLLPSETIIARINSLGYRAQPHSAESVGVEAERRDLLVRTGLAFFFWLNIMTFSLAVYASYFEPVSGSARRFVPFLLMALATPVVFYCAQPILKLAWGGLLNRAIRMETLLSLGILAAYFYSSVQAFRGEMHVYFDTASAIVALVLAGKSIERSAKERTTRWLAALHGLMPRKARVVVDSRERIVSISALQPGQIFVVRAGERIPADGVVIEGEAHADESLLTGESAPVTKRPGDAVVAGTLSTDGVLQIRASRIAADSTLSHILRLTEQALSGRTQVERTADRISRIFVPAVVLLALATFVACWSSGSLSLAHSLMRSIAILVIACPCALGLATPLAITAAIGAASRNGILVSDSKVLETITKVDAVVLDKTGTITEGNFSLLEFHLCRHCAPEPVLVGVASSGGGESRDRVAILPSADDHAAALVCLASLERYSEHPLGRSVLAFAKQHGIDPAPASDVVIHKGEGITGNVGGHPTFVGSRRLLARVGASLNDDSQQLAERWEREGKTVAFFGEGTELQGVLAFGDSLRPDAAALVAELQRHGMAVHLLSGDSKATTRHVASRIHADSYQAECLPDEKIDAVRKLQSEGHHIAMIGDGINDAPALAQADLGIAMSSGTDIAMKAAAIVLMNNSLSKVVDVFFLARKTLRIVRQNLFWAFFYNVLGIALAVAGILNPILAAGAMLLSSVFVVCNSLRLNMARRN